jgi:YHS domain-containing protein
MTKPIVFAAAVLTLFAAPAAFAQTQTKAAAPPAKKPAPLVCAVMGDKIGDVKTAAFSVYKGKKYYFCCAGCKPEFEKNPAKYVKTAAAGSATVKAGKSKKG